MADVFTIGQEASKSAFVSALQNIQQQGTSVLADLQNARVATLVEFDRRQQSINARRTRAWRITAQEQAVKFVVSDFTDIDQANTTGTVRADSVAVSLKERAIPTEAVIKTNGFSTNKGTIEALNQAQTILQVHTDDGSTPTGQFDIELVTPLTISQMIIDIVPSPSSPTITVSSSTDGITYIQATKSSLNGFRINAWLPSQEVRFIRVQVVPSHPDDLNGDTFTFGITNFSAQSTSYHLRSELLTKVQTFSPKSEFVVFDAETDPNIQYYLSVNAVGSIVGPFVETNPGDSVQIGTKIDTTFTTSASDPSLITTLPADTYLTTVVVKENGVVKRLAPGLSATDPNRVNLTNEYVLTTPASIGFSLRLIRADGVYTTPRTFEVSYIHGPAKVEVRLKVRLSTDDSAVSPVFHGATLDEA